MEWIKVSDRLPEKDCLCVVWNEKRPFQYYVSFFSKYFSEFEVSAIGCMIRIPDSISFHATHWMEINTPNKSDH